MERPLPRFLTAECFAMSTVQRVAQVLGIVLILVGVLGFVTTGFSMEADPEHAPRLLGLFPVNAVHNGVHLGLGLWGLLASGSRDGARNYCTIGGGLYLVLAVLGLVVPDTLGLIPIGGHDVWLHALLGIALLGAGLTAGRRPATT